MRAGQRYLITTADDFGLCESVNEAVERAATDGILSSASLMVGAPAFEDAVARARRTPGLAVGLHLVVIEGPAVLPPAAIPDLVDASGQFPSGQLALGIRYFFCPDMRRQLAREIRAQFEKFLATGLTLDHANAHKHMQLHPVVGRMMIEIGAEYGLRAVRVPAEPAIPGQSFGNRALRQWCRVLRRQAMRASLRCNDQILGLSDTGHMTPAATRALMANLPDGVTELYFHPAVWRDPVLQRLMPDYEHAAEFESLMTTPVPEGCHLSSFSAIDAAARELLDEREAAAAPTTGGSQP